MSAPKPCPACGTCPTCGHAPKPVQVIPLPVYPSPYWQPLQWWQQPWYSSSGSITTNPTDRLQVWN